MVKDNGQTCLEKFGIEARGEHLFRNEWRKDIQYTKSLVDAEYDIQNEFIVSSYEDRLVGYNAERHLKDLKKQQTRVSREIAIMETQKKPKQLLENYL